MKTEKTKTKQGLSFSFHSISVCIRNYKPRGDDETYESTYVGLARSSPSRHHLIFKGRESHAIDRLADMNLLIYLSNFVFCSLSMLARPNISVYSFKTFSSSLRF